MRDIAISNYASDMDRAATAVVLPAEIRNHLLHEPASPRRVKASFTRPEEASW